MDNAWIVGALLLGLAFALIVAFVYAVAFLMAYNYSLTLPEEEREKFWRELNMRLWENERNNFL